MKKNLYFKLARFIIITLALTSSEINFLSAMEERQQEQVPTLSPEDIKRNNDRLELNNRLKILDAEIKELEDKLKRGESVDQGILLILKMEKAYIDYQLCKLLRNDPEPVTYYEAFTPVVQLVKVIVYQNINPLYIPPYTQAFQQQQLPFIPEAPSPSFEFETDATIAQAPQTTHDTSATLQDQQSEQQTSHVSAPVEPATVVTETAPTKQPEKQAPQAPAEKRTQQTQQTQLPQQIPQAKAIPIVQAKPSAQKAPEQATQQQKQQHNKQPQSKLQRRKNKQTKTQKTHTQQQPAQQQTKEETLRALWLQGIKLLDQKETLYQAIDLLEQAFPIAANTWAQFEITIEELTHAINTLSALSEDPLVLALLVRIGIRINCLESFDETIKKFLTVADSDHIAKIPSNQRASIHMIQGFIFSYNRIYTEQAKEKAVTTLALIVTNVDAPAHIRAEAFELLQTIVDTFKQENEYIFIEPSKDPGVYSAIKAAYLVVPHLIAQNNIPSAAHFYLFAELVYTKNWIESLQHDQLLVEAMSKAQQALENKISLSTLSTQPTKEKKSEKQTAQPITAQENEALLILAILCFGEINRYLTLKQQNPLLEQLIKLFLAKAEDYVTSIYQYSTQMYNKLLAYTYDVIAQFMYEQKKDKRLSVIYQHTALRLDPTNESFECRLGQAFSMQKPVNSDDLKKGRAILLSLVERLPSTNPVYGYAAYDLGLTYDPKVQPMREQQNGQRALHYLELAKKAGNSDAIRYLEQRAKEENQESRLNQIFKIILEPAVRNRLILIILEDLQSKNLYEPLAQYFFDYVKTYGPLDKETIEKLIPILATLEKFHKEQSGQAKDMTEQNKKSLTKIGICIGLIKTILNIPVPQQQ